MAAKPLQVKAIAAMLESDEYETSQEMAKAILARYDELRSEDTTHIVVREYAVNSGAIYYGYGPYATRNQAVTAIEKGRAGIPGEGAVAVVPVVHPAKVAKRIEDVDEFAPTHPGHWVRLREQVGVA